MEKIEPDYGKKRQRLADCVPLDMPYALYISPAHICNFKCFYCLQGKSEREKEKLGITPRLMDLELAEKTAEQAQSFPGKLKRIMFSGCGEPLANPKFYEIVKAFSDRGVSEKYELNTNAALLTPELSDKIIDAGINGIRISIQGLSEKKYREVSRVKLDFPRFLESLDYLYKNKKDCSIYIKIIDACLEPWEKENDFYSLFENRCDSMYVEHLIQAQPNMEDIYNKKEICSGRSIHGEEVEKKKVCPLMFYQLQVDALGNVFPCCVVGLPEEFALGNVNETPLPSIWGNQRHRELWASELVGGGTSTKNICRKCNAFSSITREEDRLDKEAELLLKKIRGTL